VRLELPVAAELVCGLSSIRSGVRWLIRKIIFMQNREKCHYAFFLLARTIKTLMVSDLEMTILK